MPPLSRRSLLKWCAALPALPQIIQNFALAPPASVGTLDDYARAIASLLREEPDWPVNRVLWVNELTGVWSFREPE